MADNEVKNTSNLMVGILMIAVTIIIFLLAIVIVFGALQSADIGQNGRVSYPFVGNETNLMNGTSSPAITLGAWNLNLTGTICTLNVNGTINFTVGTIINSTNYVLDNCLFYGASTMHQSFNNTNWNISYTYTTTDTSNNVAIDDVEENVVGMITNFFELMPTVGTILAVVVLIAAIVLLILYVRRMKDSGSSDKSFQG